MLSPLPLPPLGARDSYVGTCPVCLNQQKLDMNGATRDPLLLTLVMHGRTQARPDDTVHLSVDAAHAHVFDQASGRRLS